MPKPLDTKPSSERGLAVTIAAALALKAAALTIIYLMFFAAAPDAASNAERTLTAVLGLPGR
jgi:hypothetical protein